ncbi:MAG TPA: PEGA domain-containing protein [Kofleriaceae bacterium]|nr:PEGA domain-containing protein [Kofleriaceae bacterium]
MKRIATVILVVLLGVPFIAGGPATAHAQSKDQKESAEKFFRAGERAYKSGQYLVAAQAFEEALKLYMVPAIVFSTAQAYRLQYFIDKDPGWLKRSIQLYRTYIEAVEQGGRRDDAVASLAELEPIMLRIEAEQQGPIQTRTFVPETQLVVNTQVEGARATIDGEGGEVPLIRKVEPGPHKIVITADGYFPVEQTAIAVEGRLVPVEATLLPRPAVVTLRTSSGAEVAVDGRPSGTTPLPAPLDIPAGKHFVTVTRRGHYAFGRELVLARGEQLTLDAPLETTLQRKASWWVLGGSAAIFIGAGVTATQAFLADRDAAELEDERQARGLTTGELAEYERLRDRRDDRMRLTWVLTGVGAGVAITGVLMRVFDNPRAEAPPMSTSVAGDGAPISVTPVVGQGIAGLTMSGRF